MKNNANKSILLCLCLLLIISSIPTLSFAEESTEITFVSPGIEAQIRTILEKPEGPITQADMAEVTMFEYPPMVEVESSDDSSTFYQYETPPGKALDDISDLAHCVNLESLYLHEQPLTSLEPLKGLTKLKSVTLADCSRLTDLSPLSDIPSLTGVSLHNLNVEDISGVLALENLSFLSIGTLNEEGEVDLSPLAKTSNLESFQIWLNANITDYTPLKNHPNLSLVYLHNVDSETFTDLIAAWPKLTSVSISNSSITSEDLAKLPAENLRRLSVFNCPLGDITPIAAMTSLKSLQLNHCGITDITPLAALTELSAFLDLSGNDITDLTPLSGLTSVSFLTLTESEHYTRDDVAALLPNAKIEMYQEYPTPPQMGGDYSQLVVLSGEASEATGEPITFEDKVVEIILRDAFGKTNGETVTTADMERVTSFDYHPGNCANAIKALGLFADDPDGEGLYDAEPILTLDDLAHCVNLQVLSIPFQESINSLEPLAHLANLTDINLYGCKSITDLSPLAGMQNLIFAYFGDIGTDDASPILALPNLRMLSFGNHDSDKAIDISALSNGHSLVHFFLSCPATSYESLKGHKGMKQASLVGIEIGELETLVSNWPELTGLGLTSADISGDDLAFLKDTQVQQLQLFDCPLSDLSSLSDFTQLDMLTLDNCGITDISPLAGLRLPLGLSLLDNDIRDISPLGEVRGVRRIMISESEHYTQEDIEALMPGAEVTIAEPCTIEGHHHHL